MWYAGELEGWHRYRVGYATSFDGIHWTKSPGNPILPLGPAGSWDSKAAFVGDVSFDGSLYHLWYPGHDGSKVRTGYAVSPKDFSITVAPLYASPRNEAVRLAVSVGNPTDRSFSARIRSPYEDKYQRDDPSAGGPPQQLSVGLFDDGEHGDGLAGDGLFANSWIPPSEKVYLVDLRMIVSRRKKMTFHMEDAAIFTSIGPVRVEDLTFVEDDKPKPGSSIRIRLLLHNDGKYAKAATVEATLSSESRYVSGISASTPTYPDIPPGGSAATTGYYQLTIDPESPVDADVTLRVSISSYGFPLWEDNVTIRVVPPWWRTDWAYGSYAAIVLALLFGYRRYEVRKSRARQQLEMEHFQAEKLRELDQLKSRFFANISHEFRTPLTLIEGPLKQLKSGELQVNADEQYDMMLRNAQRLKRLVNQLLDLSKIESGQMKLRAREMDVVEIVREIAASFESFAKRKGILFSLQFPEEPIIGWFDKDAVQKIMTNLLSNAFKFTPERGKVLLLLRAPLQRGDAISSTQDEIASSSRLSGTPRNDSYAFVEISVSDTGIGIPPDQLDKVFDRFYQVDASQTREREGTGIGLALTKELVELHKGEITVRSEVGKGTTFTVRLPLGKEHLKPDEIMDAGKEPKSGLADVGQPAGPENLSSVAGGRDSSTYKGEVEIASSSEEQGADETHPLLLIVEDNADMRRYMRTYLDNSYRVLEAANGEEGVREAVESIPDLIISDVMMPKMDGFQLCQKLKTDERTSHIPIILLTAKAGIDHKVEGLETGADDYLVKPFEAKELLARVKNLVEQRRMLREKFRKDGTFRLKDIAITSADERFLNRTMEVIETHLGDQAFTAELLAQEMYVSQMQLHRKIRALADLSPWQFVRKVRLHRAADLLRKRAGNVSDIAYQIGYDSPSRFAQAFREEFGQTPSQFVSAVNL